MQRAQVLRSFRGNGPARPSGLEAAQASEAAKLEPVAQAAAALADRLTELTSKREALTEELRIGRGQLSHQQTLVEEAERVIAAQFGTEHASRNPAAFLEALRNRPTALLALTVLPRLEQWLVEKQEALEETENQLAELAASAKAPTQ